LSCRGRGVNRRLVKTLRESYSQRRMLSPVLRGQAKDWTIGILSIVAIFFGIMWLGDSFRAHTLLYTIIWIATPICCSLLKKDRVSGYFTLEGLKSARAMIVTASAIIAFLFFACRDDVRAQFGMKYVSGFRYWAGDMDTDENGSEYYTGDRWSAKTKSGTFAVWILEGTVLISIFAIPTITWKVGATAINRRREQCTQNEFGEYIETHKSRY
jgi:hypothetical protein